MSRTLSIALVHHPVLDKQGTTVTSAVTNLDIHDMARSARTYGCESYFIVHPVAAQRDLVARICEHWTYGSSAQRIPDRKEALTLVKPVPTLDDVYAAFGGRDAVEVWVTSASAVRTPVSVAAARPLLEGQGKPVLLLFGTAWGLLPETLRAADLSLAPIHAAVPSGFNHLSVRAACAIILDRLRGDRS